MKYLIILLLLFCFNACVDSEKNTAQNSQEKTETMVISKDDIFNLEYVEFVLDVKAEQLFENWAKYIELQNLIDNLKQGDVSFFKDNSELLIALLKDFKETVPEQIDSPSIWARIKALETKMYKLESVLNLSNSQKTAVVESIKELLVSFSNLNLQINKKLEKESQNIQKP